MIAYIESLNDDAMSNQFDILFTDGIPGGGDGNLLRLRMDKQLDIPERSVEEYIIQYQGIKIPKTSLQEETTKEFFDQSGHGWQAKIVFKPEVLNQLKEDLRHTARQQLLEVISELLKEQNTLETINKALKNSTEFIMSRLSETILENKLERMVEDRIKEKMGLK